MNRGFTLIEFLIYIAIVGTVLLVTGAIGFNVLFGKAKLMAIEEVSQNARFTMERIAMSVRNAETIQSPVPGASDSVLALKMADKTKNPTSFRLSDGSFKESPGAFVNLTSSETMVTALQFSNISYPNTPGTIRIQMTLQYTNPLNRPEYRFSKIFYTTATIRKK